MVLNKNITHLFIYLFPYALNCQANVQEKEQRQEIC